MRILYVTDALAVWGGIERVLSDKMNYLVREYGYEVYVVTSDQGEHPIPFPLDERIVVKDLNIRFHQQYRYRWIKRYRKAVELEKLYRNLLAAFISQIHPDVISCVRDWFASAVLDLKISIPVIFESHAMFKDVEYENSTLLHRYSVYSNRKKYKRLSRIVTLTQGDANDWRSFCKDVCVIPNVVHLNESGRYSDCTAKRAIFAGRFDLQKDFGSLVEVWTLVQQRHPDWILDVYGNGELREHFEKVVSERQLNINIHPAVADIFDKYMDSSMLLMTSLYEPFGLVLAEAMSCGIPVVAFDCPYGPADIINNGVDGFLVEDRNIPAYADAVCQLIDNVEMRRKMGKTASCSARRYTGVNIMPQWDRLFKDLIS